jgi:hypothetical protein
MRIEIDLYFNENDLTFENKYLSTARIPLKTTIFHSFIFCFGSVLIDFVVMYIILFGIFHDISIFNMLRKSIFNRFCFKILLNPEM